VPNGVPQAWFEPVSDATTARLANLFRDRISLVKVARWDPDKRWFMAVDAVAEIKRADLRPLLIARGGKESHGHEVLGRAGAQGLSTVHVKWAGFDSHEMAAAIEGAAAQADVVVLDSFLSEAQRRVLFHAS